MNGCSWEFVRSIIDTGLAAAGADGDPAAAERLRGMALALPQSRIDHRPSYPTLVHVPPVVTITRETREPWLEPEMAVAA